MRINIFLSITLFSLFATGCGTSADKPTTENNKVNRSNLDSLMATSDKTKIIISIDDDISAVWDEDSLNRFTEAQKDFHYIQELEREINNGGFNQYFFNSSGNYAHETLIALKAIGANNTAKMLQNAINEFPDHLVPKDWEKRQKIVTRIEAKANPVWDKLDDEYFAITPATEYLDDLCIDYIKRYQKDFER